MGVLMDSLVNAAEIRRIVENQAYQLFKESDTEVYDYEIDENDLFYRSIEKMEQEGFDISEGSLHSKQADTFCKMLVGSERYEKLRDQAIESLTRAQIERQEERKLRKTHARGKVN